MSNMPPSQPDNDSWTTHEEYQYGVPKPEHTQPDAAGSGTATEYSDSPSAPQVAKSSTSAALTGRTIVLDLDYNAAAALTYLPFCFVCALASAVFWRTESAKNYFLRFNAMQSLMLLGALLVLSMGCWLGMAVFAIIPLVHYVMIPLISFCYMAVFGTWTVISLVMMYKAYKGETYKLPFIGDYAAAKASPDHSV